MFKQDEEDLEPSWLSKDNDHLHQKTASTATAEETEPLFGSGKIPLEGEVVNQLAPTISQDGDEEAQSTTNYGSIGNNKNTTTGTDDKTTVTNSSSKGSNSKKKTKKKARSPPQSIFDEPDDNTKDDDENEDDDDDSSVLTGDDGRTAVSLETKPHLPKRNWCVEYFRVVAAVTGLSSLGLLATQMIPLFLAPLSSQGYFDLALKFYVSLFCIIFLLVEMDAPIPILRKSPILQTFASRGFLYSFLGLMCLQEAYSERVKNIVSAHESDEFHVAWASLFMQISAWLIFACGAWYMIMGLCCLKRVRDRVRKKDQKVWTKYRKELREWKRMN